MRSAFLKQSVLASALLGSSMLTMAGSEDWLCDLTIDNNPPTGCSRWGIDQQGGLCTSQQLTGVWHCLTGWGPGPRPGPNEDHVTMLKSFMPNKLVRSEYALNEAAPQQREARLEVRAARILGSAPLLVLLPDDSTQRSLRVSAVRGGDAQVELQIHAIDHRGAGSEQLLGRLPIHQNVATVLAEWRIDPTDGPRLSLASGISSVEVSLPSLNALTRIDIYGGSASTLKFDFGNTARELHEAAESQRR